MAQFNSAEEIILPDEQADKAKMNTNEYTDRIEVDNVIIESTDVMTGDRNQSRFLYYQLKMSMIKADRIDIIVSVLMESGVRMILNDLRSALDRKFPVRILTGNFDISRLLIIVARREERLAKIGNAANIYGALL